MNNIPAGERIHIGFFGRRNAGKSSLVNAVTNQSLSVVSDVAGTTTDIVKKSMEILPLGPVVIIDTPGIDDEGTLGELRVGKTWQGLSLCDIAVIVIDASGEIGDYENELAKALASNGTPFILCVNKKDLLSAIDMEAFKPNMDDPISKAGQVVFTSSFDKEDIEKLKMAIVEMVPEKKEKYIVRDLVRAGDNVVLVIPIDESAPKGRIILPQQLVLRELLDMKCNAICCQPESLGKVIDNQKEPPSLVITDSQAFKEVAGILPESIRLTSFSVLMARYKGDFESLLDGASAIDKLQDGDKVLIAEACTHHRQCNDIGTVKIPALLKKYTGKNLEFSFVSGGEFPENVDGYKLVVHCGGCMIGEAEMKSRVKLAKQKNVPIVNYGMLFAKINGILERISNIL